MSQSEKSLSKSSWLSLSQSCFSGGGGQGGQRALLATVSGLCVEAGDGNDGLRADFPVCAEMMENKGSQVNTKAPSSSPRYSSSSAAATLLLI